MEEKHPRLAAVVDKKSQRTVLVDTAPLEVDLSAGKAVRVAVTIDNGPEGLVNLAIRVSRRSSFSK